MKKVFVYLLWFLSILLLLSSCGTNKDNKVNNINNKNIVENQENKKETEKETKQEKTESFSWTKDNVVKQSFEEEVNDKLYSSVKKSEVVSDIEKMKDSPEKVRAYATLLDYKKANEINEKLINDVKNLEKAYKLSFVVKDMNWNAISWVKVKNLLSGEEVVSNENWEWSFSTKYLLPLKVPVFLTKEWYSNYAYVYDIASVSDKEAKNIKATINLKKAQVKEISYTWDELKVSFDNKAEIDLPAGAVVVEWTDKEYKWKIKAELTHYTKREVLANKTLSESLSRAVLNNSWDSETVALETFGMIDVNLYWENGEKLNIKKESTIKIPVSDIEWAKKTFGLTTSGKTKDGFWYLNKNTWIWENLPDWYLDIENKVYIAKVSHFSNYNFDGCYNFYWGAPSFSTTEKLWRNGKNKVIATIKFHHIRKSTNKDNWETLTHTFYKNWTWVAKSKNSPTKEVKVTWFADDKTPPAVTGEIR